jgi:hypothetical protein
VEWIRRRKVIYKNDEAELQKTYQARRAPPRENSDERKFISGLESRKIDVVGRVRRAWKLLNQISKTESVSQKL